MLHEISGCAARAASTQPKVKQTPAPKQAIRKLREVFIVRARRKARRRYVPSETASRQGFAAQMAQCRDFQASRLKGANNIRQYMSYKIAMLQCCAARMYSRTRNLPLKRNALYSCTGLRLPAHNDHKDEPVRSRASTCLPLQSTYSD